MDVTNRLRLKNGQLLLEGGIDRDDVMMVVKELRSYIDKRVKTVQDGVAQNKSILDTTPGEIGRVEHKTDVLVKQLTDRVDLLIKQNKELHTKEIQELKTLHLQEVENLKNEHRKEIAALRDIHDKEAAHRFALEKSLLATRQELSSSFHTTVKDQEVLLTKRLEDTSWYHNDRIDSLYKMLEQQQKAIDQQQKIFEQHVPTLIENAKSLLASMPAPHVVANMPTPVLNVNPTLSLSEKSLNLNINQPLPVIENRVTIPDKAIQVEQLPSVVTVHNVLPDKTKRTKKHITYDEMSRPQTIEEVEIEEDGIKAPSAVEQSPSTDNESHTV